MTQTEDRIGDTEEKEETPLKNREPNRGQFQNCFQEPMKEPRNVFDSKTGTENQTGTEKLEQPSYTVVTVVTLQKNL